MGFKRQALLLFAHNALLFLFILFEAQKVVLYLNNSSKLLQAYNDEIIITVNDCSPSFESVLPRNCFCYVGDFAAQNMVDRVLSCVSSGVVLRNGLIFTEVMCANIVSQLQSGL